ncbi:MAG: hypothetical protein K2X99_05255 [Gemmatimonadaceae bacterium]|nr:hypothetical protein [Gemmatimonadaceae bacterium]
MRPIRRLAALLGILPAALAAQQPVSFNNAWFWGASGGQISFPTAIARTTAPEIGVDWLITRTRFGLQVYAAQSYFDAVSTVDNFTAAAPRGVARLVDMQDLRRVGFNSTMFTPALGRVRPYVGVGYSFNFVKSAIPRGTFYETPAARDTVFNRLEKAKASGKLNASLGLMVPVKRFAPFAQVGIMPARGSRSWLVNGNGFTYLWSLGLRVNAGSSIEK